ncbi:MAG: ribose 5-phosphate isomerase A [Chloroflexi bacterium]|nr:MAG: ribose 5-phosphate isomerase A [Chloroflexota bacterium]
MTIEQAEVEAQKKAAAGRALELVRPGTVVGLGSGSTARYFIAGHGADEIDPTVNCLKGRGGALLREKIVAHASRRFVVIADESKLVGRLGRGPVPIEVLPFLWEATSRAIESLGGRPALRLAAGQPYKTDNDNLILDTTFGAVDAQLGTAIHAIPGVLEHGLFFGIARAAIIGCASGLRILGELG